MHATKIHCNVFLFIQGNLFNHQKPSVIKDVSTFSVQSLSHAWLWSVYQTGAHSSLDNTVYSNVFHWAVLSQSVCQGCQLSELIGEGFRVSSLCKEIIGHCNFLKVNRKEKTFVFNDSFLLAVFALFKQRRDINAHYFCVGEGYTNKQFSADFLQNRFSNKSGLPFNRLPKGKQKKSKLRWLFYL